MFVDLDMEMLSNTFDIINSVKDKSGYCALALIDSDPKNDNKIDLILEKINLSNSNAILIGGSSISDDKYEERVKFVKDNTDLPLIIFPSSSKQITKYIDIPIVVGGGLENDKDIEEVVEARASYVVLGTYFESLL